MDSWISIVALVVVLLIGVPWLWHVGGTGGPYLSGALALAVLIVIVMLLSTMT
jgi:hypothetical protein